MAAAGDITLGPIEDADLPAITEIFNHYILTTTVLWRTILETLESRGAWLKALRDEGRPTCVAKDGAGVVLGYAVLGNFRAGNCYARSVELSLYIGADYRRKGLGQVLLDEILRLGRAAGYKVVIGGVDAENVGSVRLLTKNGFKLGGRFPATGEKFGKLLDLELYQLNL